MIALTLRMQKATIDKQRLNRSIDRGTKKAIVGSLNLVRKRAKTVYQRRTRASRPGESPSIHSTDPTRSLLNMGLEYDEQTKSGVMGPVKLSDSDPYSDSSSPVPGMLEGGGSVTITEASWDGRRWSRVSKTRPAKSGQRVRRRTVPIAARPAISKALETERRSGNIMSPWANVVTG